ncbi:MAG: arginyl-tRNA synthetase [Deferribacteres bacterium]|jgi:arginyl-tRNA synthetase|nr:Arginyl-tRNA synthetase [Deferribacteraceae bacterium]MDK2792808.1 arginyl-tRNA synthetase [Deferribacteres bacterium]
MENLIRKKINETLYKLVDNKELLSELTFDVEVPKDSKNGDFATNVAMKLASMLKKSPRAIAEEIKLKIGDSFFEKIEVAGPGFINFFVSKSFFYDFLLKIIENQNNLMSDIGSGKKVQVEFVSANPTGPLHIGHGRGAAYGDSLARLLSACGFDVQKEYYINDAGNQMNNLALSIYSRYLELSGVNYEFPQDGYKGEYIIDIAKDIKNRYGDSLLGMKEEEAINLCFRIGVEQILETIRKDLEDFRVTFDNWFSEKSLYQSGEVDDTLTELQNKEKVYEHDGALWFKSTEYGDDKDRVLKRGSGELTYFASDIAYHRNKIRRGFDYLINVWGADHHGYVKRLKSSVSALGFNEDMLEIKLVQMVGLVEGGEKISMSTRAGTFVELRWLLDKVGSDAARYFYIMRDINSQFEFDIDLALSKSSDNPVYYVQYAHARVCSILRNAEEKGVKFFVGKYLEKLNLEQDMALIKKLYEFKSVLETAANLREPHRIPYYLQDLAALFHNYYKNNQILNEDDIEVTSARVTLCLAVKEVIKFALNLIGVDAPERM